MRLSQGRWNTRMVIAQGYVEQLHTSSQERMLHTSSQEQMLYTSSQERIVHIPSQAHVQ